MTVIQPRNHQLFEILLRGRTIEQDRPYFWIVLQQLREIISPGAVSINVRIQATGPVTTLQRIPQNQWKFSDLADSFCVVRLVVDGEQLGHNRPEGIAWMRVVLHSFKRGHAGHTAQDYDTGSATNYRFK